MCIRNWRLICILGITLLGCNNIRPESRSGPVIDSSRIVAVADFTRGTLTPPLTLLVKHFYYGTQPAAWSVVSSGVNTPVTRFETVAVYANTPRQTPAGQLLPGLGLTRVFTVPNIHSDGNKTLWIHLAPRQQFPASPFQNSVPAVLVYIEGGPIYGGLRLEGTLDPQVTAESIPRLLVDAQVLRADLASDGVSIIYVDIANKVFSLPRGQTESALVVDLVARFGHVTVKGIRWHPQLLNTVNILINRGGLSDELWSTSATSSTLTRVFLNPAALPDVVNPATIAQWEENTKDIPYDQWKVPAPDSF